MQSSGRRAYSCDWPAAAAAGRGLAAGLGSPSRAVGTALIFRLGADILLWWRLEGGKWAVSSFSNQELAAALALLRRSGHLAAGYVEGRALSRAAGQIPGVGWRGPSGERGSGGSCTRLMVMVKDPREGLRRWAMRRSEDADARPADFRPAWTSRWRTYEPESDLRQGGVVRPGGDARRLAADPGAAHATGRGAAGVTVWCFARAYDFAFYVIGHYVDPSFKFAGLGSFVRYLWKRRGGVPVAPEEGRR